MKEQKGRLCRRCFVVTIRGDGKPDCIDCGTPHTDPIVVKKGIPPVRIYIHDTEPNDHRN